VVFGLVFDFLVFDVIYVYDMYVVGIVVYVWVCVKVVGCDVLWVYDVYEYVLGLL